MTMETMYQTWDGSWILYEDISTFSEQRADLWHKIATKKRRK